MAVDPHTVTTEDLTASIDVLTRKLSKMPEWLGNLLDPARSAELVAARCGKASYDKPEAPLTEAGMKSATPEDRAYALTQLSVVVNFDEKHLCFGRGAPSLSATAPLNPYAPNQIDEQEIPPERAAQEGDVQPRGLGRKEGLSCR